MKASFVLFGATVWLCMMSCSHPTSHEKLGETDSLYYGDSVSTYIQYTVDKDSANARVLKIFLTLRNTAGRTLVFDSDQNSTRIKIYKDSSGNPPLVWVSPENVIPDTATVILPKDSVCRYQDTWRRMDYNQKPILSGTYIIQGTILGFRTRDLTYNEL